jgi:putative ABC transport system substrate-binding protein
MKRAAASSFLVAVVLLVAVRTAAQSPKKATRIGVLSGAYGVQNPQLVAFRQGLLELGYIEGQNIDIEYRHAEGRHERFHDLAADLVRLKVNLIYACCPGGPTSLAAKKATATIPIVFVRFGDAVQDGAVASLAQPGGNVTGVSGFGPELDGKRLELLKEVVPKLARLAVLMNPAIHATSLREFEPTAKALGVQLQVLETRTPSDLDNAFSAIATGRVDALYVFESPLSGAHRNKIVEFAAKNRLPSMFTVKGHVEAGGLIFYGINIPALFHRSATYVDRILKGAKAADLPVERPTKIEFVINLKTAKQIRLTIPPNVLVRADRVIK